MRSCEQTTCGAFIAISISFMSRPLHSLTQLEPKGEDVSIQPRRKKNEKKKKNQTQDTGALAGFSSDKPPERRKRRGFQKKKKPALFNCGTSIKASKWGRLGGTLAHQTDTPNTHHLYAGLLKKERSKFLKMKRGLFPAFIPPPTPIHPLPLFFFFFFTKLRKRGFGRHVKRT